MLTGAANVEDLVEALECDSWPIATPICISACCTDFPDASAESLNTDAHLLALAEERINELNQKYWHGPARVGALDGSENFPPVPDTDARASKSIQAPGMVAVLPVSPPPTLDATARSGCEERKRGKLG